MGDRLTGRKQSDAAAPGHREIATSHCDSQHWILAWGELKSPPCPPFSKGGSMRQPCERVVGRLPRHFVTRNVQDFGSAARGLPRHLVTRNIRWFIRGLPRLQFPSPFTLPSGGEGKGGREIATSLRDSQRPGF